MMIPTPSIDILKDFGERYINLGLGAILVQLPDLGTTNTPNAQELKLRRQSTLSNLVPYEVGGVMLNGYKRCFINNPNITYTTTSVILDFLVEWEAYNKPMGPFTHYVLCKGLNKFRTSIKNGNNRGNSEGIVLGIQPVPTYQISAVSERPDIIPGTRGLLIYPDNKYVDYIKLEFRLI